MKRLRLICAVLCLLLTICAKGISAELLLNLGPEQLVEAGGVPIQVGAHSVPSYVDLNGDNRKDLLIGEKTGSVGKVRIYLNSGTSLEPLFGAYFYAQANGADLVCPASDELGCFPRAVLWDLDSAKDLLVGQAGGTVRIFKNVGDENNPAFDAGYTVRVGYTGSQQDLDVGDLAASSLLDWDNDGREDIVSGGLDGRIHLYINCGCLYREPAFYHSSVAGDIAQQDGSDLIVPEGASSPDVFDLDGDGKKDLLIGNSSGQLLFYSNVGLDNSPDFADYALVKSCGVPIELGTETYSRPFVCDWNADSYVDVLLGAADGTVRLYQGGGGAEPPDLDGDFDFDGKDFAILAAAWRAQPGHENWNPACDISEPSDNVIDELDLYVISKNWLAELQ